VSGIALITEATRVKQRDAKRRWRALHPYQRRSASGCEACERVLDPKQWAYLAGIFDGEGSVHLAPSSNSKRRLRTYHLCVTVVCGTHKVAIEAIQAMIGRHGSTAAHGRKLETINGKGSRRAAWRLRIYGNHAAWFLRGVQPYVLMRTPQTQLGINHQLGKKYQGQRCSDERAASEAAAKSSLTRMNMRGVRCAP
jgi:hypothetical protein